MPQNHQRVSYDVVSNSLNDDQTTDDSTNLNSADVS